MLNGADCALPTVTVGVARSSTSVSRPPGVVPRDTNPTTQLPNGRGSDWYVVRWERDGRAECRRASGIRGGRERQPGRGPASTYEQSEYDTAGLRLTCCPNWVRVRRCRGRGTRASLPPGCSAE